MNKSNDLIDKKTPSKCLLDNWVEERATAELDAEDSSRINKHGHKGILSVDTSSPARHISTARAHFIPPTGPGERQRGIRGQLFEKHLHEMISGEVLSEFSPIPPDTEFISTTQRDYKAEGFQPASLVPSKECDYRSEQAISFWSDNYENIQGISAVRCQVTPFRKNCAFSTPISKRLDDATDHAL